MLAPLYSANVGQINFGLKCKQLLGQLLLQTESV
jgi:hypothetical protein